MSDFEVRSSANVRAPQSLRHAGDEQALAAVVEKPSGQGKMAHDEAALGSWWREQLAGAPPLLAFPVDHPRPSVQSFRGESRNFTIDPVLTEALRAIGAAQETTLSMVIVAGFAAFLHRYTGQEDLVIGIPSVGQESVTAENSLGVSENMLPLRLRLRLRLQDQPRFVDLLRQVRERSLTAFDHAVMPFERIVEELGVERLASHNPIVQVAIAPPPPKEGESLEQRSIAHLDVAGRAVLDLTLACWETPEGMAGRFAYSSDLFERATIERLTAHFIALLASASASPERAVGALNMLTPAERRQLTDWNHTAGPAPKAPTFHELFAIEAARAPNRIAVTERSGRSLTYGELDARSNRLAHHLREHGVGPDDLVAVCIERSVDSVVGILGVLKAGGAYLPIDPTYPATRLAFIISDAAPKTLVTQAHLEELVPGIANVVRIDADAEAIARKPDTVPPNRTRPEHLAYVIYTSGSTGQPKGALIEHRNLVNLIEAHRIALGLDENARLLQFSALGFDASVWEFTFTLGIGASLCMSPPGRGLLGVELGRLIQEHRITCVALIPSILPDVPVELLASVEVLIACGEPCSAEIAADGDCEPENIFLTGATGFVGAHLLAELLGTTSAKIHCLVRARDDRDAMRRLRAGLASYSFPVDDFEARVRPIVGELGAERLGLDEAMFDRLAASCDAIFHNGAKVDHVRSYPTMKLANVFGTHEVLRLASRGRRKPVHFISTIGTIHPPHYRQAGVVHEDAPAWPLSDLPNGYMQSKCVAEHMVTEAMARGLPAMIYRLGAITGHSVTGACNPNDYTHSSLRSMIQLGFVDDLDFELRLTPVDFAARAIVALSRWRGAAVVNVTNPRAMFWLELVELVNQCGYEVRPVSYAECMRGLLDAARQGIDTPMLAFLPFHVQRKSEKAEYLLEDYYVPIRWDCERSLAGLTAMGVAPPPEPRALVHSYLEYLRKHGLVPPPGRKTNYD